MRHFSSSPLPAWPRHIQTPPSPPHRPGNGVRTQRAPPQSKLNLQQCTFVSSPTDIKDLLMYTTFWCSWIHEHHEGEETLFFPALEEFTGVKGLMEKSVDQHHAFMSGLKELENSSKI